MDNDLDPNMVPDSDMDPEELASSEPVNRPADNADHGNPSDAIGGSFGGSDEATDFLGLGDEGFDPVSSSDHLAEEEDQANSWLFTLDEGEEEDPAGFLEPRAQGSDQLSPEIPEPADDWASANAMGAEQCLSPSATGDAISGAGQEYDDPRTEYGDSDEYDDDLDAAGLNTSWSEDTPKKTRASRMAIRAGAAALVLMLGFAGFQFFSAGSRISETANPSPLAPGQNQTPGYRPRLTTPGEEGAATGRESVGEGGETTPVEDVAGFEPAADQRSKQAGQLSPVEGVAVSTPGDTVHTPPPADLESTGSELGAQDALVARADSGPVEMIEDTVDVGSKNRWRRVFGLGDIPNSTSADSSLQAIAVSGEPADGDALAVRPNWIDSGSTDLSQYEFSSMRLASPEDLANVWHGFEIPMEEIHRADRLLTPMVGGVRVVLKTGELFEGRLYAVGEGRVWLDSNFGRTGLAGERVETIVHILGGGGKALPGRLGAEDLAGLPYVRVRALGGVFFAKLIYRDDDTTTVVTREGTRITIPSDEVEILGNSPSVVLKQEET